MLTEKCVTINGRICVLRLVLSLYSPILLHIQLWQQNDSSYCAQLCPILCNPMDYSLPGSSVHKIIQAGILEWVSLAFLR